MTMKAIHEVFERYKEEYWKGSRVERSKVLDTVCETTNLHRKSAVRKFKPHNPRGVGTPTHGVSFSKEREETEFPRTTARGYGTMSPCSNEAATVARSY